MRLWNRELVWKVSPMTTTSLGHKIKNCLCIKNNWILIGFNQNCRPIYEVQLSCLDEFDYKESNSNQKVQIDGKRSKIFFFLPENVQNLVQMNQKWKNPLAFSMDFNFFIDFDFLNWFWTFKFFNWHY